jgi:hypothetical protein
MTHSDVCPLCHGDLRNPQSVEVCGACRANLDQMSGTIDVTTTGEFAAVSSGHVAALMADVDIDDDGREAEHDGAACSWCGKHEGEVRKILSRGDANICNGCVALCADIMELELGDDWKS